MSIADKLTTIAENQQRVYDAGYAAGQSGNGYDEGFADGKQAEYDRFWDDYLNPEGIYATWSYRFAGIGWNDDTFRPPCDIVPTGSASMMFAGCGVTDMKALCQNLGIKIDLSKTTSISQIFADSNITTFGVIDTTGSTNARYILYNAIKMIIVDKVILKDDGSQTFDSAFLNCRELEDITFEGVIGKSADLHWSTKLTRASIESIITHLSDTTEGQTLTLSSTAVEREFAYDYDGNYIDGANSAEWYDLIETKPNWTISLV